MDLAIEDAKVLSEIPSIEKIKLKIKSPTNLENPFSKYRKE